MKLPNLFVVGAMKAGTTTLYGLLRSHPKIFMSSIKEPNYFCDDLWGGYMHIPEGNREFVNNATRSLAPTHHALIKDFDSYTALFSAASEDYTYVGEATPSYLRSLTAASAISRISPHAKIIIVTRDPIERAWSHFLMESNEYRVGTDFDKVVDEELKAIAAGRRTKHGIVESGLYYAPTVRYIEAFGMENVLVVDQSQLFNLQSAIAIIGNFLEVDQGGFVCGESMRNAAVIARFSFFNTLLAGAGLKNIVRKFIPQSVIDHAKRYYYIAAPKSVAISDASRIKLKDFYSDDVKQFSTLLKCFRPRWMSAYYR